MFKIEAIGNLGADAEVRESNGGKFISLRIAHSEKWEGENGDKHETTQWIDVVINNPESKLLPYLKEGVKIFVRGHASLRTYSSPKLRQIVAGIQVNALEVELCGGIRDDVPRELINPDTSELLKVQRLYWSPDYVKGLKKNEVKVLIDKKGNGYLQDNNGFIQPDSADDGQPEKEAEKTK